MPRYRATITQVITHEAGVELEAENEEALCDRIADEDYHQDQLLPRSADVFIDDIENLDENTDDID